MNKFVFIGIIALVLGTAGVLVMSGEKEELPAVSSQNSQTTTEQQQQVEAVLAQYTGSNGTYTHKANSEELTVALTNSPENDKKVLFFEGKTCPSCRELDINIRAVDMPDNVHVYNVLYEENPDLVQKYQVRGTPGLYQVDNQGNTVNVLQLIGLDLDSILLQLI